MTKHVKHPCKDPWFLIGKPHFQMLSKVAEVQPLGRHAGHANLWELRERVLFFLTDGGDERVCRLNSWENKSLLYNT